MENTIVPLDENETATDDKVEETPYNVIRNTLEENEAVEKEPELATKKVVCADCGKSVLAKTLKYSHKLTCKKTLIKNNEQPKQPAIKKVTTQVNTKVETNPINKAKEQPQVKPRIHRYSHIKFF